MPEIIEILQCRMSNKTAISDLRTYQWQTSDQAISPPSPTIYEFTGPWKPQHRPSTSQVALYKHLQMESCPCGRCCEDTTRLLWRSSKLLRAFGGTKPLNPWWRNAPNVSLCGQCIEEIIGNLPEIEVGGEGEGAPRDGLPCNRR